MAMDGEIGKPPCVVIAHSFKEESVGKSWAVTKKWFSWRFSLNGEVFAIDFTMSRLSGRKKVIVNGRLEHEEKSMFKAQAFHHTWEQRGQSMTIAGASRRPSKSLSSFDELGSDSGGSRMRFELWIGDKTFDEFDITPLPASAITKLTVKIRGARGLRKADWWGLSDPYCVCEITNKRGSKFRTPVIERTVNPDWEHEETVSEYIPGDSLTFTVYDRDKWLKNDDMLGIATLHDGQFYPYGFHGDIELSRGGNSVEPVLRITVLVSNTPHERELREIFERCDQDGDGKLNKRELIKALRVDKDIAIFFELPQHIRQEDGSRDEMERIFQAIDTNGDRLICWDEFKTYFASRCDRGKACERGGRTRAASHSPTQSGSNGRRSCWESSTPEATTAEPNLSLPMLDAPPSTGPSRSRRRERAFSVPHPPSGSRRSGRKKSTSKEPSGFGNSVTSLGFDTDFFQNGGVGTESGLHRSCADLASGFEPPQCDSQNFAGGDCAWPDQGWHSPPPGPVDSSQERSAPAVGSGMCENTSHCTSPIDPWQTIGEPPVPESSAASGAYGVWDSSPDRHDIFGDSHEAARTEERVHGIVANAPDAIGTAIPHDSELDPWVNLPAPFVAPNAAVWDTVPSTSPSSPPCLVKAVTRSGSPFPKLGPPKSEGASLPGTPRLLPAVAQAPQAPPWDVAGSGQEALDPTRCVPGTRPAAPPHNSPVDIEMFWKELDSTLQVPTPVPKHPWAAAPPLQSPVPQHLAPAQGVHAPLQLPSSRGMVSLSPRSLPTVFSPAEQSPGLGHAQPPGRYLSTATGSQPADLLLQAHKGPWCT